MKKYCINDVFTEFLNSACENSATAVPSDTRRRNTKSTDTPFSYSANTAAWKAEDVGSILTGGDRLFRSVVISPPRYFLGEYQWYFERAIK